MGARTRASPTTLFSSFPPQRFLFLKHQHQPSTTGGLLLLKQATTSALPAAQAKQYSKKDDTVDLIADSTSVS